MDAFEKAIQDLQHRRDRIVEGKINCIPLEFPRLSESYYGLEEVGYNIYTANQKVGKSKLVDEMCVYHPFFYSLEHPDQLKVKILYFSMEMSKQRKYYEFLSHLLYKLDKIRISPKDLQSTKSDKPCPQEIINKFQTEKYRYYTDRFKETVEYVTNIKNPTGIYKYCKDFAKSRGHWVTKAGKVKNALGEIEDGQVNDYFIKDNPEEYWIVVLDNFTNLTLESGMNKLQNIEKMSKYCIELRDDYLFNMNVVQHQAQDQENSAYRNENQLEPTAQGLGDCKMSVRDVECLWGLFNPAKFNLSVYPVGAKIGSTGYDIRRLGQYCRFLKLLEGRDGGGGDYIGLFFDGATSTWYELPRPNDTQALEQVYQYVASLNMQNKPTLMTILRSKNYKKLKKKKHVQNSRTSQKWLR